MNRNEVIRKNNDKCADEKKKCDYLCSNMCNLFRVQLDPTHKPLRMCDFIYSVTYKGRP